MNNESSTGFDKDALFNKHMLRFAELVAKPIVRLESLFESYEMLLDDIFDLSASTLCVMSFDPSYSQFILKYVSEGDDSQKASDFSLNVSQKLLGGDVINILSKVELQSIIPNGEMPEKAVVVLMSLDNVTSGALVLSTYSDAKNPAYDNDMKAFYGYISNVLSLAVHKRTYEKRINKLVYNDYLTGLPNRTRFCELMLTSMQYADFSSTMLAVLMLDIDRFKQINDLYGYEVGDDIIKQVGKRIRSVIGERCIVSRFGNDDFAVLIPDVLSIDMISVFCENVIQSISMPMSVGKHILSITASIGVCLFPHNGDKVDDLLKNVELAMMEAKAKGRNQYVFYLEEMSDSSDKVNALKEQLETAINEDQFELFYQALINIEDRRVNGVEALIRWRHPEKGIMLPYDFIPFAEEVGLITEIDKLVVNKACEQVREWLDNDINIGMSINVSPEHFRRGGVLESLSNAVKKYNIPPQLINIEILESALLENREHTIELIGNLKEVGVMVSLDDFGTGFSSIEHIANMPIDTLKIDRSFTMKMDDNANNRIVLKTIVSLAKEMNCKVVAEGVEKETHMEYLSSIGCDMAQGYFINKPLPVDDIERLIIKHNS